MGFKFDRHGKVHGDEVVAGGWAWSGELLGKDFTHGGIFESNIQNVSVGLFQVHVGSKGRLRSLPVVYRVIGSAGNPEAIVAKADEICRGLMDGRLPKTKVIRV